MGRRRRRTQLDDGTRPSTAAVEGREMKVSIHGHSHALSAVRVAKDSK
jgi:hypothetical protein